MFYQILPIKKISFNKESLLFFKNGKEYLNRKEYQKAIEEYQKIIEKYPLDNNVGLAKISIARVYEWMDDNEQAMMEYENYLDNSQKDPVIILDAIQSLIRINMELKRNIKIFEYFNKLVEKFLTIQKLRKMLLN